MKDQGTGVLLGGGILNLFMRGKFVLIFFLNNTSLEVS